VRSKKGRAERTAYLARGVEKSKRKEGEHKVSGQRRRERTTVRTLSSVLESGVLVLLGLGNVEASRRRKKRQSRKSDGTRGEDAPGVDVPPATDVEEVRKGAGGARVRVAALVGVVVVIPLLGLDGADRVDIEQLASSASRVGSLSSS
jgi:hypothetical protein